MTIAKVAPPPFSTRTNFFSIMKKTFQLKLGIFSQLQSTTIQYVRNQIQSNLYLQTPLLSGPFTKYPAGGGGAYLFRADLRESLFERAGATSFRNDNGISST